MEKQIDPYELMLGVCGERWCGRVGDVSRQAKAASAAQSPGEVKDADGVCTSYRGTACALSSFQGRSVAASW